jgi:hypothetical protein
MLLYLVFFSLSMAWRSVVFRISVFSLNAELACLVPEHRESKPGSVHAVCGGGIHAALYRFNTPLTGQQNTSYVHYFREVYRRCQVDGTVPHLSSTKDIDQSFLVKKFFRNKLVVL